MFLNPKAEEVAKLLRAARTIAVVGLSPDRTRPSHGGAKALQRFGYRIIAVNRRCVHSSAAAGAVAAGGRR